MANMSPKKNPIPEQDPNVRNKNFEEVALGYTVEMAVDEANRCLNCPRPACMSGCPVNVKIPQFIARVREQDFKGAYHKILEDSSLPAICGRVCPQEKQCESKCVRGIKGEPVGIGRLERFVADWHAAHADPNAKVEKPVSNGHRVAVVGSGPAGLTCAGDLARMGYEVTVYELFHKAGGVLVYGIPEFRLPKAIVAREVAALEEMGVKIVTDAVIGRAISIDELLTGEVPAQIQQSVSAAEARRAQGRYQVAKIVAGALLVAGSVIGLITEVRLFWVKPFYMFIEIYLLVLAFVLVVVGAMVFLIGLVRYRTEMQHLNTANRIEALAALAGAGLFPLFTVLRFLHAYTRPGMAVFIVLLAVAVGLWIWRLAVDCKKLQAEKSHPIAEKD